MAPRTWYDKAPKSPRSIELPRKKITALFAFTMSVLSVAGCATNGSSESTNGAKSPAVCNNGEPCPTGKPESSATPVAKDSGTLVSVEQIKTMLTNTWQELSAYIGTQPLHSAEDWIRFLTDVSLLKQKYPEQAAGIDQINPIYRIITGPLLNYGERPISLGVDKLGMGFTPNQIKQLPTAEKTIAGELVGPNGQPSPLHRPTAEQTALRLFNFGKNVVADSEKNNTVLIEDGGYAGAMITVDTADNIYPVTFRYALDILKKAGLWDNLTPQERIYYATLIMNTLISQRVEGSVEWGQRTIYYVDANGKQQPLITVSSGQDGFVTCAVVETTGQTKREDQALTLRREIIVEQTATDPKSINIEVKRGQDSRNGDFTIMINVNVAKLKQIADRYPNDPQAAAQAVVNAINETVAYEIADVDSASNGKNHVASPRVLNQYEGGYTVSGKSAKEIMFEEGLVTLMRTCGKGKPPAPVGNKPPVSEIPKTPTPQPKSPMTDGNRDGRTENPPTAPAPEIQPGTPAPLLPGF